MLIFARELCDYTQMLETPLSLQQAQTFLLQHLGTAPESVSLIGAGAWSQCFAFRVNNHQDLVIRFGKYLDDFQKDQRAYAYATPALPIPKVTGIGITFDGYYAISTRVYGIPLEEVNAAQWQALVPALADALEAMRTADISATTGFGGWGEDGNAKLTTWAEHLLLVDYDGPDRRTYGWHDKLAKHLYGMATFERGFTLLQSVAHTPVPRCLVHCDLINRNALVEQDRLTGVFDWGCSLYGDHLYELAWFEFWSEWHPALDIVLLRKALAQRWHAAGYVPHNLEQRLMACYLHIGLDHLAYHAFTGDTATLTATANRIMAFIISLSTSRA